MQLSIDNLGLTPISPVAPLTEAVRTVFSKYGSNAHLYIAGPNGLPINGFQPGNYFDSAGTTLASVDGSVGLVLDAAGGLGAECYPNGLTGAAVANGASVVGAVAALPNASATVLPVGFVATPNTTYKITFDVVSSAGSYLNVYIGTSALFGVVSGLFTGRKTVFIKAANSNGLSFQNDSGSIGGIPSITLIECKPVTGIHATQSTPGYKPTLRKGIVNLLKSSNDLTSADWLKTNATVGAAVADPDGGMNAKKVSFVYGAGPITRLYQDYGTAVNGAKYTFPIWLRSDTPCQMLLGVQRSGPADVEQTVIDITASWQLFVFSHSGVFTGSSAVRGVLSSAVPGFSADVEVYRPGLFQGALTAAQILAAGGIQLTTTAPASSVAGVNYAEFDGIDDRLGFSAPLFQLADDHTVIVGAKNLSSGNLTLFEVGDGSSTARVCSMRVNSNNFNVLWNDGTTSASAYTAESTSGVSFVATGQRLGNSFKCRRNSGAWASATAMLNPTVSTTTAIGNRTVAASYEFHKGPIYCVLAIKGTVSDADLAVLEKFVAQLSGVQL